MLHGWLNENCLIRLNMPLSAIFNSVQPGGYFACEFFTSTALREIISLAL
ncbi:Uncharacterized protein TCM_013824 [Theobroma cacao]|uniref:Uncharacterized protein n=1 Tax=Theobroma cacao TaxID=3641 RepID=A0A061G3Z2_THECC|nr:Uncharacterized protein TCM_013824 [Theobroma cacao]